MRKDGQKMLREYEVAKTCMQCGELILLQEGENLWSFERKKFHLRCRKDRKRDRARKRYVSKGTYHRDCEICNTHFDTTNPKKLRCDRCYSIINKHLPKSTRINNERIYDIVKVAVTCVNCQELIVFNPDRRYGAIRFCSRCEDVVHLNLLKRQEIQNSIEEHHSPNQNEIYQIAKDWTKKNCGKLMHDQKQESLGTFTTASPYRQDNRNGMERNKDGSPNFKREVKVVKRMKRQVRITKPYSHDELHETTDKDEGQSIRSQGKSNKGI
jgi:hypothetical protein